MSKMILQGNKKCKGCMALKKNKSTGEYECRLNFEIQTTEVGGEHSAPAPAEPCYKPKSQQELRMAEKQLEE